MKTPTVVSELDALRAALRTIGCARRFRPGATSAQLHAVERSLGWGLPQEISDLLSKADGMEHGTIEEIAIFRGFYLVSSEEVSDYAKLCSSWAQRRVVPVLTSGSLSCFGVSDEDDGVYYLDPEENLFLRATDSVAALFSTIRHAIEVGTIRCGPGRILEEDDAALDKLGARLNAGATYWTTD